MRLASTFLVACAIVPIAAGWSTAPSSVDPPVVIVTSPVQTGWHVPTASMEPTLHCARPGIGCLGRYPDRPVVSPINGTPPRGDIVVFKAPPLARIRCGAGGDWIARIIGLPGEKWSERSGYVFINGTKLNEPYVAASNRDFRTIPAVTIPPGRYFVLGDNRSSSCDSRAWGTVRRADIIGEVTKVYREK